MPDPNPASITAPKGFRAAGVTCGLKPSGKPDLALIVSDGPCSGAGVFTTNQIQGAPVVVGRRHLRSGRAFRAIVCNSGNSNVATGRRGLDDADAMCRAVADAVGCKPTQVLPASTGVIGRTLPMGKLLPGIAQAAGRLGRGVTADAAAATAILTTDLIAKTATRRVKLGSTKATLGGIAKGSGMIAPSLATMLAFLTTDANVPSPVLRKLLRRAATASFNRLSVDTDTSTSDTVYLLASGAAGGGPVREGDADHAKLLDALTDLCSELAYAIVRDGEGATRVFRVLVKGAASERDADRVGRAVADSPLVKCAVHGADPNWGRLAMAVGKSGAALDPEKLELYIGQTAVFRDAMPIPFTPAVEKKLAATMSRAEVTFTIDLRLGDAGCTWLGCDLSRDYVAINADYTT